jgi:hypothetical protein
MSEKTEKLAEIIVDQCNALEALAVNTKRQIAELFGVSTDSAVKEETFSCLKFETQQGSKLGTFEVAFKQANIAEKFNHAYNILRNSNATIKERYHGPSYQFSYWLYAQDRIYRQKMKK